MSLKIPIATKLSLVLVVVIASLGTLQAYFVWDKTHQTLVESVKTHLLNETTIIAESINTQFAASQEIIHHLGEHPDTSNIIATHNQAAIHQFLNSFNINNQFLSIYFIGADGIIQYSTDESFIGLDVSARRYFQNALNDIHQVTAAVGLRSNKLGFYMSHRLSETESATISGVIAGKLSPQRIIDVIEKSIPEENTDIFVADKYGTIIYSSDPSKQYKALYPPTQKELDEIESHQIYPFAPQALTYPKTKSLIADYQTPRIFSIYDQHDGEEEIMAVSQIGDHDLFVITEQKADVLNKISRDMAIQIFRLVGITLIITIATIYALMRRFLRPIKKINTAINEIAHGKYNTSIRRTNSNDEFDSITNNLNSMFRVVAKSHTKLEKEVDKRTAELNARVQELEKFNKLIVSRELKMRELKREIKELKAKVKE